MLQWIEPAVRWQPYEGRRHAHRPRQTAALCGVELVIQKATEIEWLDRTCPECQRAAWRIVNPALPNPHEDAAAPALAKPDPVV